MPYQKPDHPKSTQSRRRFRDWLPPDELPQSDYKYGALQGNQIRLLHLQPSEKKEDTIFCSLEVVSLDNLALEYIALSYTWGNDEPLSKIRIQLGSAPSGVSGQAHRTRQDGSGLRGAAERAHQALVKSFYIRSNLEHALREFRLEDKPLVLWCDAICINQSDNEEKSQQIQKMVKIYHRASEVAIWLGREEEDSHLAVPFIYDIQDSDRLDQLVTLGPQYNELTFPRNERKRRLSTTGNQADHATKNHSSLQGLSALMKLMQRSWFSRRWVVQELAVAKRPLMFCGGEVVEWEAFALALDRVRRDYDQIRVMIDLKRQPQFDVGHPEFECIHHG